MRVFVDDGDEARRVGGHYNELHIRPLCLCSPTKVLSNAAAEELDRVLLDYAGHRAVEVVDDEASGACELRASRGARRRAHEEGEREAIT